MPENTKLTTLEQLKLLAQRVNTEDTKLSAQIQQIVTTGGEPNVITGIKVNGTPQAITDKAVDIPVPTALSQLANDSDFQTGAQVAATLAAADHLKRKIVGSVGEIDVGAADAAQYIYMVQKAAGEGASDRYDEYMVINSAVEQVGSWAVSLADYATTEQLNQATADTLRQSHMATDQEVTAMLNEVFGAAG